MSMRIGGAMPGQGYFAGGAGAKPVSGSDAYSKNIEEQIRNAEKRLQNLSRDDKISPDERRKKQQELRKEITELQAELRQHEIELRQEEWQQKTQNTAMGSREKGTGADMEDMLGGEIHIRGKGGRKRAGFSDAGMRAMISADASLKQADVQGAVKEAMEGKAGVLESEIKLDQARGADTAKKEMELADLKEGAADPTADQLKTLSNANKEMQSAGSKAGEETAAEGPEAAKERKQDAEGKDTDKNGIAKPEEEGKKDSGK